MKMLRSVTLVFLVLIASILFGNTSYAHPTAAEHNKELTAVLFEDGYSRYQSDTIKNSIQALEYASYLTIDQFGGSGESQFDSLKKMKIGGLPIRFSAIDYSIDFSNSTKQINANSHRRYTHQGWDRVYTIKEANKFWNTRRNILLGTVNSILNFKTVTILGYDEKCNSLAGIIYYTHILGDYDEADSYKKISLLMDLSGRVSATDKDMDYDMVTSLKKYIETLFNDQKNTSDYKELVRGLDTIGEKAGRIVQSVGGVNTDEEFEEYHEYAKEILDLLTEHVPKLLKKEAYFQKVFYPDLID